MPFWARNRRDLFYLDANNLLTSVPVQLSMTFKFRTPAKVLSASYLALGAIGGAPTTCRAMVRSF
jgi:hypothetical protein